MTKPAFLDSHWARILACPMCKQGLTFSDDRLICERCAGAYPVQHGIPILLDQESLIEHQSVLATPDGREMLDKYHSASLWARFIWAAQRVVTVEYLPYPPDLAGWIRGLGPEALVVEVGSGKRRLTPEVVNLDIGLFPNVDVVGDGARLPFLDSSLDFLILDVVLEHVKYPAQFVQEARRALKPGGCLYVAVPFVHPYHGYPIDYHRFSLNGLEVLLEGFTPLETGVLRGPMAAFLNCFSELPFLFTFSSNAKVYQATKGLALVFTFWLKYFDWLLMKNRQAHRLAHSLYFLGRKTG